jgi:citrate lyase subunit beta/citryl-CoA lyase
MSRPLLHPLQALFGAHERAPSLPVCDHYAGVEARMTKALTLQADMGERALFDVTLDLEDGAPLGGVLEHAQLAAEMVAGGANRHGRVGVRIHPLRHPCFGDVLQCLVDRAGARLAYLMLPKAAGLEDVRTAAALIEGSCKAHGVMRAPPLHVLIETHGALREVAAIAALPQVQSLSFGLMDFVSAHHGAIPASGMSTTGQFKHPLVLRAKLEIAAACHASSKTPSHSVVTEFNDEPALRAAARCAARELGYTRMWSIHPRQIRPIVEAFAPVAEEVETAAEILLAAQAGDWAPIAHRGVLQDRASFRYHWHVLERAERTGRAVPHEAHAAFFAARSAATGIHAGVPT